MPTLEPSLRDQLAAVIGKENAETGARLIAEAAAKAAIEALAVHLPAPHPHLKDDQKQLQLRNALRARARQLGDTRHADGRHELRRLVEQAAYEHWHRMLFARFLAENDLLIHPEMDVPVTLAECAELADGEGAADGWELAGRFASRMLPQIFRPDDPLLGVRFAIDDVKKLEALLDSLPTALFRASDSLGWCYQFWQAKKKKEVNASEVKIGADELPAVTQLFTEPYMVRFLLDNTLGAWWAGKVLTTETERAERGRSEAELRALCAAGVNHRVSFDYLRFTEEGAPAAGTFEGWPRHARELRVLDPCCGSGHFLVGVFEILVAFRIAEEGLSPAAACDAVLRDNLFGLEIDARCVQIAAFALAMAAWTTPGAGGYRPLAPMNVACSGLAISAKKEEWERLGGDNLRLKNGMGRMWELFSDAPVLGSLIDPTRDPPDPLYTSGPEEVRPLLQKAMIGESNETAEERETRVAASGIAEAARILAIPFNLVVTNVPYVGGGAQVEPLRRYVSTYYSEGKADLATAFLLRSFHASLPRGGTVAAVAPQNWLLLPSYSSIRKRLLTEMGWNALAWLGSGAFDTISGEVVNVGLWVASRKAPTPSDRFMGIDASGIPGSLSKSAVLTTAPISIEHQAQQVANPDYRVLFGNPMTGDLLAKYADSFLGLGTGDGLRYLRKFWEVPQNGNVWEFQQGSVNFTQPWAGLGSIVAWDRRLGRVLGMTDEEREKIHNQDQSGQQAWEQFGVAVSLNKELRATLYAGNLFDKAVAAIIPKRPEYLLPIWAYLQTAEYGDAVRRLDKRVFIGNATLVKVPFDLSKWTKEAARLYPSGVPSKVTSAPDQWIFSGHPPTSDAPLQVAVARLLGYRWPDQPPLGDLSASVVNPADPLDPLTDKDGLVCIPALGGERPAADRLAELLAAAWGEAWHPQTLTDLLAAVGHTGTLEEWLRDSFFKQHCELFHHRPFIWQIWDGHREGFSALVNYHKLNHEGLKSLTYTYLGDWIRTQELEAKAGKSGAGDKLAKAKALQGRLAAILEGEAPLDIFVRWKPIEQQPIGWSPDLDDGVRLNIRPFLTVADVGAKGAGVLRWKPNIKWGVDRGKNPPGSTWGEDRDNDRHLSLAEKRAAREKA
jgi:hypothetical protein